VYLGVPQSITSLLGDKKGVVRGHLGCVFAPHWGHLGGLCDKIGVDKKQCRSGRNADK
jgi:hypothetical protein